jgi:hypothetical protein
MNNCVCVCVCVCVCPFRNCRDSPGKVAQISCDVICPSFTDTAMVEQVRALGAGASAVVDSMGPLIRPEAIADGVWQLVDEAGRFEPGRVLMVTSKEGAVFKQYGGFRKKTGGEGQAL